MMKKYFPVHWASLQLTTSSRSSSRVFAAKIKGNDGPNLILGTPEDVNIDAQGGNDIVDGDGLAEPGTGEDDGDSP
jgi:hypothetical protein